MIQANNNLSVLPFYTSIDEQLHRRSYAYGDIYPLFTPVGNIPPFQIVTPHDALVSLTSVTLYKPDGTQVGSNILSALTSGGLHKYNFVDCDVIVYPASTAAAVMTSEGQYYLCVETSDGAAYFSDIMTAVGQISPYLKIEWNDAEDLVMDGERIVYQLTGSGTFKNRLYLNTEIGKPDYEFEEQGETRDGLFFPEKMISEKKYKFTFLASEYLCDVMRFIRMSDVIKITDRYGREYLCDTFLMTPKWETQGNLASVEVEFQTNTVAKRIGRNFTT